MPKRDGAGPQGAGSMTGRGMGPCTFGPCGFGCGWRRGFGTGHGLGRYFGWNWPQIPQDQKKALTEYKKALEEELEDVRKEEEELEKQA